MDDRSLSLVTRLGNADEEVPGDLPALSASSFLKASSSRSNLDRNLINNCWPRLGRVLERNLLSAKDLDVKATPIPYAD